MDYRPENPAKTFLKRYRSALFRQQSLIRSLNALRDRQTNCTVKLNAIQVQSGGFVMDRMAEEVVRAMELEDQILEQEREAAKVLSDVLKAIASVPDETQKAVLTMRYVEGLRWEQIQEQLHYEQTQVFVLHGRGLWAVNHWMEVNNVNSNSNPVYGYGQNRIYGFTGKHG